MNYCKILKEMQINLYKFYFNFMFMNMIKNDFRILFTI